MFWLIYTKFCLDLQFIYLTNLLVVDIYIFIIFLYLPY